MKPLERKLTLWTGWTNIVFGGLLFVFITSKAIFELILLTKQPEHDAFPVVAGLSAGLLASGVMLRGFARKDEAKVAVAPQAIVTLVEPPREGAPATAPAAPQATLASGGFAPCPRCGVFGAEHLDFTWWGGLVGPRLLHHVECGTCGHRYNGKTGGDNTIAILFYVTIAGTLVTALLVALLVAAIVFLPRVLR